MTLYGSHLGFSVLSNNGRPALFTSISVIASHPTLPFFSAMVARNPLVSPFLLWPLGKLLLMPTIQWLGPAGVRSAAASWAVPPEKKKEKFLEVPAWPLSRNCPTTPTLHPHFMVRHRHKGILSNILYYFSPLIWRKQETDFL